MNRRDFLIAASGAGAATLAALTARGESSSAFRAGAAAVDITPPPGVRNDGVIMRVGPAGAAHDRLHARSLALDDGTTRLVLTICDVRMIGRRICDDAKALVSKRTGIPAANLLVAATHTHAAPTPADLFDDEPYLRWQQAVIDGAAESMCKAVANLVPAQLGWASVRKPEYAFNRRWKVRGDLPANPFGEKDDRVLTNPGGGRERLIEPAGPVDDEFSVVSVRHADGKPLAVLGNYSTHYVGGYAGNMISSDYYGVFSERVKEILAAGADSAFVAMMFNGTSGDVNTMNFAAPPKDDSPPWVRMKQIGDDMADAAVKLVKSIDHRADLKLAAAVKELELGVRKPDEKRIEWARSVLAGSVPKSHGWSARYANEALELVNYPDRAKLIVQAMRIGSLGITGIPCEVFAQTGLEIKERSPLKPTINIGLANGYNGYLPTPEQHALGGYETWPARSSHLEVEASRKIRDAALDLLGQIR